MSTALVHLVGESAFLVAQPVQEQDMFVALTVYSAPFHLSTEPFPHPLFSSLRKHVMMLTPSFFFPPSIFLFLFPFLTPCRAPPPLRLILTTHIFGFLHAICLFLAVVPSSSFPIMVIFPSPEWHQSVLYYNISLFTPQLCFFSILLSPLYQAFRTPFSPPQCFFFDCAPLP